MITNAIVFIVVGLVLIAVLLGAITALDESCPAGGFHRWEYTDHFMSIGHFECDKCLGNKTRYLSENEINYFEYKKNHK